MIFTIANPQAMNPVTLARWERASIVEVRQVAEHWTNVPRITFGPNGVTVTIQATKQLEKICGNDALGCHWYGSSTGMFSTTPLPFILTNRNSVTFTHEIIETVMDPQADEQKYEICDPVEDGSYMLKGVRVTDFAYGNWYEAHSKGPWDQAREVKRARSHTIWTNGEGEN